MISLMLRWFALAFAAAVVGSLPAVSAETRRVRYQPPSGHTSAVLIGQQRFSPLDQVNTKTVQRLVPKWIYQTGAAATFSTSPLVADGVMYITAPFSHVVALDAKTGRQIWRYDHKRTSDKICCGPANRGAAIGYGKVFVATVDARLVALDQKTGKPAWDIALAEKMMDGTEDKQVMAADDPLHARNITGSTGAGRRHRATCVRRQSLRWHHWVGYGLHLDSPRPGAPLGAVVGVSGRYGPSRLPCRLRR